MDADSIYLTGMSLSSTNPIEKSGVFQLLLPVYCHTPPADQTWELFRTPTLAPLECETPLERSLSALVLDSSIKKSWSEFVSAELVLW